MHVIHGHVHLFGCAWKTLVWEIRVWHSRRVHKVCPGNTALTALKTHAHSNVRNGACTTLSSHGQQPLNQLCTLGGRFQGLSRFTSKYSIGSKKQPPVRFTLYYKHYIAVSNVPSTDIKLCRHEVRWITLAKGKHEHAMGCSCDICHVDPKHQCKRARAQALNGVWSCSFELPSTHRTRAGSSRS